MPMNWITISQGKSANRSQLSVFESVSCQLVNSQYVDSQLVYCQLNGQIYL